MQKALIVEQVSKTFFKDMEVKSKRESKNSIDFLKNLIKKKEVEKLKAIDNVSLFIKKGEIYGVLGENGSGKSTLIRMISTLLTPDNGNISIFGNDVMNNPKAVRQMINKVSVEASFFKKLSALENLSYTARLYGINISLAQKKIRNILEILNFDIGRLNDPIEDFSRGMQQKIAISRALLTTPVFLLLDEPTTGLDPKSKLEVKKFILKVREEHDTTMLLTTHDMKEAEELCDRIAILQKGKIITEGTLTELKERYFKGKEITLEDIFLEITGNKFVLEEDTG